MIIPKKGSFTERFVRGVEWCVVLVDEDEYLCSNVSHMDPIPFKP